MNRSRLLRLSIGLANSLFPTRHSGLRERSFTQVTRFSQSTQFNPTKPYICNNNPFNFHQNIYFSSTPAPALFIDLVLSNDWSEKIEEELEKLNPKLTHESVVYILIELNTNPRKSLDFFKWVCVKKGFRPSFSPYFILLKTLACKGFMAEFWEVFSEMRKRGFYIDHKSYSYIGSQLEVEKLSDDKLVWTNSYKEMVEIDAEKDVADSVLGSILSFDWSEDVIGMLKKKLRFPLTENFVIRILAELSKQPMKALKFFEWIETYGGCKYDSVTCNAMAQVIARPESVSEFWDFVKKMRTDGYEIDSLTLKRASMHLPQKDAVGLFEFMNEGPYKPSLQQTSSLLTVLTKVSHGWVPDMDSIYRVFNTLVDAGNTPTKSHYDGVHRALCTLGRLEEAKKVVEDMKNSGYEPDNRNYSHEIFGLCKIRRLDEASELLEQMELAGCVPNVRTWTMLIEGYCFADQMYMALSCFQKMEKNVKPDSDTLSVLLKGFMRADFLVDAYDLLTEFVKNEGHAIPTQETCNLMIAKLTKAGKLEEALNILSMMKQHHHKVNYQPVIEYITKCGTVEDAKRLLTIIAPHFGAAGSSYKKVIEAFLEQGRSSEANELYHCSPRCVIADEAIRARLGSHQDPRLFGRTFSG